MFRFCFLRFGLPIGRAAYRFVLVVPVGADSLVGVMMSENETCFCDLSIYSKCTKTCEKSHRSTGRTLLAFHHWRADMTGGCHTRADMTARQAVVVSHVFNEIIYHTRHNVEYLTCANMLSHLGLDPTSAAWKLFNSAANLLHRLSTRGDFSHGGGARRQLRRLWASEVTGGNRSSLVSYKDIKLYSPLFTTHRTLKPDFTCCYRCYRSVVRLLACLSITFVHYAQMAEDIDTISCVSQIALKFGLHRSTKSFPKFALRWHTPC